MCGVGGTAGCTAESLGGAAVAVSERASGGLVMSAQPIFAPRSGGILVGLGLLVFAAVWAVRGALCTLRLWLRRWVCRDA